MSEASLTRSVRVANRQGLHARAAVLLAELARGYQARVELVTDDHRRALTTDVLQILTLGSADGDRLDLVATGCDAEAALDAIAGLFAEKFGEDERQNH